MKNYQSKRVWIIGASSGIGHALAYELDRRGASLVLSARTKSALVKLNDDLKGSHSIRALDVSEYQQVVDCVKAISASDSPIDCVIFMAAVYQPMRLEQLDMEHLDQQLRINFNAAFYIINAVLPVLKQQDSAQLAFCASVAGYRGLAGGQPYSATKAALINLTESLKTELNNSNIDIRLICPGFVRTPMTDKNNFQMPLMIEPEQAATQIADGLLGKQFEIHFPKLFTRTLKLIRIMPNWLFLKIAKKL